MRRALKIAVQVVWAAALIIMGTWMGAAHGWVGHGWLGAIVLGTIGCGFGALLAASPLLFLQLFQ